MYRSQAAVAAAAAQAAAQQQQQQQQSGGAGGAGGGGPSPQATPNPAQQQQQQPGNSNGLALLQQQQQQLLAQQQLAGKKLLTSKHLSVSSHAYKNKPLRPVPFSITFVPRVTGAANFCLNATLFWKKRGQILLLPPREAGGGEEGRARFVWRESFSFQQRSSSSCTPPPHSLRIWNNAGRKKTESEIITQCSKNANSTFLMFIFSSSSKR